MTYPPASVAEPLSIESHTFIIQRILHEEAFYHWAGLNSIGYGDSPNEPRWVCRVYIQGPFGFICTSVLILSRVE